MEDLIASIAADAGVEPGIAKKSVGMILAFLRNEGPKDEVDALFAVLPGAAEAVDAMAGEDGVGAFADAMGGGLMGLSLIHISRVSARLPRRSIRRHAARKEFLLFRKVPWP